MLFKVNPDGSTTQFASAAVSLVTDGKEATMNLFGTSSMLLAANSKYKAE